jgi:hypothetical protein
MGIVGIAHMRCDVFKTRATSIGAGAATKRRRRD